MACIENSSNSLDWIFLFGIMNDDVNTSDCQYVTGVNGQCKLLRICTIL